MLVWDKRQRPTKKTSSHQHGTRTKSLTATQLSDNSLVSKNTQKSIYLWYPHDDIISLYNRAEKDRLLLCVTDNKSYNAIIESNKLSFKME